MPWLYFEKAIRLSRDIIRFLAAIWSSLCVSCSMYRFIPPVVVLAPHDSNVVVYAQVCWLSCVFDMPLFGLVQATGSKSRSCKIILHFADGGAMNFQREYLRLVKNLRTHVKLFDRRFTWNDCLCTSPVILPPNFDWVFSTVVISSKSLKRATPRGRIWDSQWLDASVPLPPFPLPLASFFCALPIFRAAKTRALADLDRFLGFPLAKNVQERLLRRLKHMLREGLWFPLISEVSSRLHYTRKIIFINSIVHTLWSEAL